jgi:hypothetical protein
VGEGNNSNGPVVMVMRVACEINVRTVSDLRVNSIWETQEDGCLEEQGSRC